MTDPRPPLTPGETESAAPTPLEYRSPASNPSPQGPRLIGIGALGLGYAVAAGFGSVYLMDALTPRVRSSYAIFGPGPPEWTYAIPALLLGLPFVVSLCFRGWRSFAIGMLLLVPATILLIIGICSMK